MRIKSLLPFVAKFLLLASGFFSVFLTAKFFGVYQRGVLASALAIVSFVGTVGSLSVGRTILYEIEKLAIESITFFKKSLFSILVLIIGLISISIVATIVYFSFFPNGVRDIPISILFGTFLILPYLMWAGYSNFVFSAVGHLTQQSIIVIINELCFILSLILFLVVFKVEIIGFVYITAFFRTLSVIIEILYLYKIVRPFRVVDIKIIKNLIFNGLKLHLDSISGYFIAAVNVIIVNNFMAKERVGNFDLSMRLTTLMLVVPTVVQVFISGDISQAGLKKSWHVISRKMLYCLLFISASCFVAFVSIDFLVNLVFGKEFIEAASIFKLLIPYIICNTACVLFSPILLTRGYFKTMSFLTLFLGFLNVGLGFFLVPKFGTYGMAISTNIVYITAVIINIFYYISVRRKVLHHS